MPKEKSKLILIPHSVSMFPTFVVLMVDRKVEVLLSDGSTRKATDEEVRDSFYSVLELLDNVQGDCLVRMIDTTIKLLNLHRDYMLLHVLDKYMEDKSEKINYHPKH